jgi:hypothetical protein
MTIMQQHEMMLTVDWFLFFLPLLSSAYCVTAMRISVARVATSKLSFFVRCSRLCGLVHGMPVKKGLTKQELNSSETSCDKI